MRDYTWLFYSKWDVAGGTPLDPTGLNGGRSGYAPGETQDAANALAGFKANQICPGGAVSVSPLGKFYVLLSRGFVLYLLFGGQSVVDDMTRAAIAVSSIASSEGINVNASPKAQKVPPFNGKPNPTGKLKAVVSAGGSAKKLTISLDSYLQLLLLTWEAGFANGQQIGVPARWLDRLRKLIDQYQKGQITPSQVYAWLSDIDFSR